MINNPHNGKANMLRRPSLFLISIVLIVTTQLSRADPTCTAQAPGSHCDFTLNCDLNQKCKQTYDVGGGATIAVNIQCHNSTQLNELKCESPDVWQSSCKFKGASCECDSTDQGFKLNVSVKCKKAPQSDSQ